MKIWVDDIRTPPDKDWIWAKTSKEAIEWLEVSRWCNSPWCGTCSTELMSLDHDLGGDDTTRPVVIWMCENDFWPVKTVVHSANPVGVEWLEGMIERYGP